MKAVLFDLETSGMDPARHAIIQIAAIAVELEDLSEISEFECKVKFRLENASEDALKVNSYDPEVWDREAIVPSEACQRFTEFLDPFRDVRGISKRGKEYFTVQTIAYNARFDIEFLQGWYKRLGVFCPANWRAMCTMQLALWSFVGREQPENYQLGDRVQISWN